MSAPTMTPTVTEVSNMAGQTFSVGGRVRHSDGWLGTITAIRETRDIDLLIVDPDDIAALPRREAYLLNPEAAERTGNAYFCRPRDHGRSMGNYTPL